MPWWASVSDQGFTGVGGRLPSDTKCHLGPRGRPAAEPDSDRRHIPGHGGDLKSSHKAHREHIEKMASFFVSFVFYVAILRAC
jgi:hypothetical protein